MGQPGWLGGLRGHVHSWVTCQYFKPGLFISTACVLIQRYKVYGVLLAVPLLTTLQYIILYIESSGGQSAQLIKFDLRTADFQVPQDTEDSTQDEVRLTPERRRNHAAALRMRKILNHCGELKNPSYIPTPWASYTWINIGLHMVKSFFYTKFSNISIDSHTLNMEDGGEVFVEVCSDPGLLDDSPIIILLHTITGSSKETKLYMKQALKRGWRGIVFDRRGHVGKLKSPAFNVLGEADDTVKQVEFVRRKYPKSFLGMVGISAGSGLLVNYLGKCGELTPIQAACCLCPAYDISEAFKLMAQNFPHIDRRMTNAVKKLFILPNAELLGSHCYDSLEMCANAATLDEFVRNHHYFAGCSSAEDYFANNNPMEFIGKVSVPLLVVNSEDDMVCLPQNIREDLFKYKYGNTLLLRTKRGSHIAYNEGLLGQGSYLPRISLEFLQAARQVLGSNTDLGRTSRSPSTYDSSPNSSNDSGFME
ncbi:protein ABHD1 [Eurytemora carolleeae]|uniref:protein ABHD1 n=1 Tax=Eurytemora carolleeae TaxID=1294199 RepID=UPI000C78FAA1|nr:protein ABHD1 [Eurytemora carolleeae]|eukprot:XP_023347376.1 protein ABHD1-like [Eurytemora affinis]